MIPLLLSLFLFATPVYAHPIDTAFFDFEPTASGTTLTVAMQPPEAFEVVRTSTDTAWNTERFRERGDMLAAFVGEHVELSRGGQSCEWDPVIGPVATSTFDALADGITVAGLVVCPVAIGPFTLMSDLFMDRFPGQRNMVRVVGDDPYVELMTMTSSSQTVVVDLEERPQEEVRTAMKEIPYLLIGFGIAAFIAVPFLRRLFRRRSTIA
ncbi:hypothetical protein A3E39_03850 [Candidatus Uhrbacteria bacterium RIFCSPHIGHO2_12_FULL_60_25]|uniref:Uncharacterized protein n=1 Tax=Candidatus Uhrbacteria bacterium RIFCSPHIGHO2_12_FULL_60_25 TaxID=1802399 RepID=A0A1F7UJ29_9BACT|nr:MAG: hypothetical protein A3D73_02015 [Candidatus Uhrbacteria bacterium RIFCSPHIGHO2_02_FULL_60_44]OGL78272.1 MAG: hypothetical protein A3E39_03850 [Candidatus Uhrbacteria bacterium RIFCSPHIGHO2_12_FULL_60_25]